MTTNTAPPPASPWLASLSSEHRGYSLPYRKIPLQWLAPDRDWKQVSPVGTSGFVSPPCPSCQLSFLFLKPLRGQFPPPGLPAPCPASISWPQKSRGARCPASRMFSKLSSRISAVEVGFAGGSGGCFPFEVRWWWRKAVFWRHPCPCCHRRKAVGQRRFEEIKHEKKKSTQAQAKIAPV